MSKRQNILIYGSPYEHINRGCMEDLLNRFSGSSISISILQCTNSHHACYLNKALAHASSEFNTNFLEVCNLCVANQSVFSHYCSKLGIHCSTIIAPKVSCKNTIPIDFYDLVRFCLPELNNSKLALQIGQNPLFYSICINYCDSTDIFIDLLRSVVGEVASIRKDTSHLENHMDFIIQKFFSVLSLYKHISLNVDFKSFDYAYVFNGRFIVAKILSIFCEKYLIPWSSFEGSFEWGPTASRYNLVDQGSLQNFRARSLTLHKYATSSLTSESRLRRILLGCRSLKDRIFRKEKSTGYRLFIDQNFVHKDVGSSYVLFLTTSLFEFYLTNDFLDGAASDQLSMLKQIILCLPESSKLVIREHPNSSGKDQQFKHKMRSLVSSMLPEDRYQFIASEEHVDTYYLIQAASVVLGPSSLALVEALFLSVPMYFLSPAIYSEYLPSRFCPWSDVEALSRCMNHPFLPTLGEISLACQYFYDYNSLFGGQPLTTPGMLDLTPSREVLIYCRHYDHLVRDLA